VYTPVFGILTRVHGAKSIGSISTRPPTRGLDDTGPITHPKYKLVFCFPFGWLSFLYILLFGREIDRTDNFPAIGHLLLRVQLIGSINKIKVADVTLHLPEETVNLAAQTRLLYRSGAV
jgi:hypothetical protein